MWSVVLMLNQSYEPLCHIDWQRAITLVFSGKAEILEEYEKLLHSVKMSIKAPAVIRLLNHARVRRTSAKFTRENLFSRDGFVCQYCYQKFAANKLTFDHVVPIAHGGRKTWDNIVTACEPCNTRKEGRTPDQAGMKLLKTPRQPAWSHTINIMIGVKETPSVWKNYLYHGSGVEVGN